MYKSRYYAHVADPVTAIERDSRRKGDRVLALALVATTFLLFTSFWFFTIAGATFGTSLLQAFGMR